ncbi:MAG: site-2 protease family protein [Clostridia bacterium]|nr:site-2 protease family protein [Clostridia bacterium]
MHIVIAILALSVLVLIHEFGHFIFAKIFRVRVNEFSIGLGPKLFGFRAGETFFSLRALPFGGACMMEGEDGESDPEDWPEDWIPCPPERTFTAQKPWKRLIILVAGAALNLLCGVVLLFFLILPAENRVVPVIGAFGDEYAETGVAGLQVGDEILKINGERVYITNDISILLGRGGDRADILVRRDGEKVLLENAELKVGEYTYNGQKLKGYGLLLTRRENNLAATLTGAVRTAAYYVRTVRFSIADIFRGQVKLEDMSGPVGITATMSEVAKTSGISSLLSLVAYITINLGVMNLLPIPALDGGRVVFLAIEKILSLFGVKMPRKYEAYVNAAMLILLLGFIALVSVNDVVRLFK